MSSEKKRGSTKAKPMIKGKGKVRTKAQRFPEETKKVQGWCDELANHSATELKKMVQAKFPKAQLPARMTKEDMCKKLSEWYETRFPVKLPVSFEELEELDKNMPESFIDPVTMSVMLRPTMVSSGFSYEKTTVEQLLESKDPKDPTNREELDPEFKEENKTLQKVIHEYFLNTIGVDIDKFKAKRQAVDNWRLGDRLLAVDKMSRDKDIDKVTFHLNRTIHLKWYIPPPYVGPLTFYSDENKKEAKRAAKFKSMENKDYYYTTGDPFELQGNQSYTIEGNVTEHKLYVYPDGAKHKGWMLYANAGYSVHRLMYAFLAKLISYTFKRDPDDIRKFWFLKGDQIVRLIDFPKM